MLLRCVHRNIPLQVSKNLQMCQLLKRGLREILAGVAAATAPKKKPYTLFGILFPDSSVIEKRIFRINDVGLVWFGLAAPCG